VISEISLNGTPLDLDNIEYQVQIQHGRSDVTANPQPSNAQIIIRGVTGVNVEIADLVNIQAYNLNRFTGEVSDVTITHLSSVPPVAISTITAIGELSRVGFYEVGASGYSEQTVSQRIDTVLTATGLTYLNGADTSIVLHAISSGNAEPTDALSYLGAVAEWTGATFFDDPSGRIVFESYGNRGITTFGGAWSNIVGDWDANNYQWDASESIAPSVVIPPAAILFTPEWSRTRQTIINSVTVLGFNDTHETTQTDSASIGAYGTREYRLSTEIKDSADVVDRAGKIISAQANPLWSLGGISILVHNLGTTDRNNVLGLVSGRSVSLSNLPQPAPVPSFVGIVEGWGETYTPGEHILTLSLSDPRYSYETLTWGLIDNTIEWGDIPSGLQWFQIVTNLDLVA